MAHKMLKFIIVIIALLGSIMMIDARRTNTQTAPSRTVTRTVTRPAATRTVVRPATRVVVQQPVQRVVVQQPPVQRVVVQQPPVQRVVVQQQPRVIRTQTVVRNPNVVVVPSQPLIVRSPVLPFTRPASCSLNPSATVNKYRVSDEQRYNWNCLTNIATPLGFMPSSCIVGGQQSTRKINTFKITTATNYSYDCATKTGPFKVAPPECLRTQKSVVYNYQPLAPPQFRYTSYNCRTNIGPIPASSSMGLIIGVIIGICICLCIVGAIFGNKGGDETYEEQLIVQDEVVYVDGPEVVYEQQVVYEQPQVVYEQQPMYDQYQQPVTYIQNAGVDMYTGQQVIDEVEM